MNAAGESHCHMNERDIPIENGRRLTGSNNEKKERARALLARKRECKGRRGSGGEEDREGVLALGRISALIKSPLSPRALTATTQQALSFPMFTTGTCVAGTTLLSRGRIDCTCSE